jgi:mono/diheme cytochrome c family protein
MAWGIKLLLATAMFVVAVMGFTHASANAQSVSPAPFTQEQADGGRDSYIASCASCHGPRLSGGDAPALIGKAFNASWGKHTTAELYTFIQKLMPFCQGGTLADEAYTDIVAFILSQNGAKAGSQTLTSTTNARIGDITGAGGANFTR